jgi:hypothetical protein
MGLFSVSMHVRTSDDQALPGAMSRKGISRCRCLPARNGWATLYEEHASEQDDDRIQSLTGDLSRDLRAPAIAFMVHDSDIACYWLFENGRLLDHFNSCPDYFDDSVDDEPSGETGGRPEVLLRFACPGVEAAQLETILSQKCLFAENLIEELAEALGIDAARAIGDYRNGREEGDEGEADFEGDDDGGRPATGGGALAELRARMAGQLSQMFGGGQADAIVDPRVQGLVDAAANDDLETITRLLDEGADINAQAATRLPGAEAVAGLAQFFPQGAPKISLNALLAAISGKHPRATKLLLERGADPNLAHPLYGTPLHVAVGAGDAELVRLLLDRGADPALLNSQKLTPLQVLAASKANVERMEKAQEMMKSMGIKLPGNFDKLAQINFPVEGWAACEKLLKERRAV